MRKNLIKEILLEQKEEIKLIFKDKIIERDINPVTKGLLDSELIKVIMGIRRCGKSVLSHQLLRNKKYGYINFDDERLTGLKAEDLNDCLEVLHEIEPGMRYLLLDEVQNVEGWELFVNRLKRKGYNIIVTESNSRLLSKELATHLTGRYFGIELYPFSFREFLSYKELSISEDDFYITERKALIKRLLEEYIEYGGLPEVFKIQARGTYLRELFDKIVTRDIILRYGIKYGKDLKEIALYAFSNFSSKLSYHKIRKIFEIKSVHTVKNYLNYLEDAYLMFQVYPFSFKLKEQIKQPRKIFCIDTGLINAIIPRPTIDKGRLLENIVFLELKRQGKEIYFYSTPGYEIDFLIKEGLKIKQLIQVCYSLSDHDTRKREIKALIKASREFSCDDLLVITWDEEEEKKVDSKVVRIVPLWKYMILSRIWTE